MIRYIKALLEPREHTFEVRNFNIVHGILLIGVTFFIGFIHLCFQDPFYTYLTVGLWFFIFVMLVDANRTGHQKYCAIATSLFFNMVFLPICYIGYGKPICFVPIFFLEGLFYTILLIEGKLTLILSFIESLFFTFIIIAFTPSYLDSNIEYNGIDVFAIIISLVITGILGSLAVKYRLHQYKVEHQLVGEMHKKVIEAYDSKDIFLANTSHEIRTPLNAIVGTVNLLLDENLDAHVRDNVYNILNSCNALLSITDELMDLSNTNGETINISLNKYDISEMLTDIINMMAVRLMETQITLYVDIDKNIPRYLYGDGAKLRQVFINLLNNAVKYTIRGKIILRVKSERINSNNVNIYAEVEDTGIGIKADMLSKLFDVYKRDDEDIEKRHIEGTGIGLSLCKDIVEKMGGNISVKSEYHVGSTFYFNVIQQAASEECIIKTKDMSAYKVLVYERTPELSHNIVSILRNLSINPQVAESKIEFETYILSGNYSYIFIAAEKYTENFRFLERKITNERVVVVSDVAQSVKLSSNGYQLTRPVYNINAIMALQNESNNYARMIIRQGGFYIPDTTILVVDDNLTNLEVASGLMKKYGGRIITALSGFECLNILETEQVDMIFLDYMMPEMNGIDTLNGLRAMDKPYLKTVPVVALTANVVNGAREMFLEAGFDDYIAKPIDITKLEKTLRKFIPNDKIVIKP